LNCMKRVFFVLMFLVLAGGVLAMDDPIRVKSQPGDRIEVYAWPVEFGPLLNMDDGIVDENGIFETTFFSLNVPVKFNIFVSRDNEKIINAEFSGHNIEEPLNIECNNADCKIVDSLEGIENESEVVVEEVENETVVIEETENESEIIAEEVENETVVVEDVEVAQNKFKSFIMNGKAIFSNEDGSFNLVYSFGGFGLLLLLCIFIFGLLRHGKSKDSEIIDEDEKELEYMEKKVKETEDKIKNIKEKKNKVIKIENAKRKLAEEEAELKRLEGNGDDDKVEEQKDVVEKAEDNIEKAEED